MKTQAYTTKTRSKLRSLVKLMKQQGLSVTSNEKSRKQGDQWGAIVKLSNEPVKTRKKRYTVKNNRLMSKFNSVNYSL